MLCRNLGAYVGQNQIQVIVDAVRDNTVFGLYYDIKNHENLFIHSICVLMGYTTLEFDCAK
jgi:hypothetical protein